MRTPDDIKHIIESTAEDGVGDSRDIPGWDKYYGYGRINAYQALNRKTNGTRGAVLVANEMVIYPIPAQQSISIRTNVQFKVYQARIFNSVGQLVYHSSDQWQGTKLIDLSRLHDGYYVLQLNGDKGSISRSFNIMK